MISCPFVGSWDALMLFFNSRSEQTIMAIAGHVSRKMLELYSHIRMEAKRAALDAIARPLEPALFQAGVH